MKFDILEHDQRGTGVYKVWDAPFTEEDWENGEKQMVNIHTGYFYIDCQDTVDDYVKKLTEETLNAFSSTSYSAQPQGEFEIETATPMTDIAEALSILASYMVKEDSGICVDLLQANGFDEDEAQLLVDKIERYTA